MMLKGAGLGFSGKHVFLMMTLIIFLSSSRKIFWYIVFPFAVLIAAYYPIGFIFGKPSYKYLASVFATNSNEMMEFMLQVPLSYYMAPFLIIGLLFLYRWIIVKFDIKFYRNRVLLSILIIFAMFNQTPLEFFKDFFSATNKVASELKRLNSPDYAQGWGVSTTMEGGYKNYVLVIGESARKDYHGAYGYPIANTPFMSASHGVLVDGFTGVGANTIESLRLMLTKPDAQLWEPNYHLNFVDLARSAGFETYWLSNQGSFGKFDTPISLIAGKSAHKEFLKKGAYDSGSTSDFELIDLFKGIVEQPVEKNRLIVLHLYGSHSSACERIADFRRITEVKDSEYDYLNCYISSIEKTDVLLERLNGILEKAGEPYSMVYFADHGMGHIKNEGQNFISLVHGRLSAANYAVPLFKVASDDRDKRVECKSFKLGLNFVDGLAKWMHISNPKINGEYDLFNCTNDTNDYDMKLHLEGMEKSDPAIDLTDK